MVTQKNDTTLIRNRAIKRLKSQKEKFFAKNEESE